MNNYDEIERKIFLIKNYCLQSWNIGNGKKRKPIGK